MDRLYEWRQQYIGDRVSDDFLYGAIAGWLATILLTLLSRLISLLRSDGIYDLAHWKLNIRVPLQPMWMNMGYWRTPRGDKIQHLDQACAALLREVLREAGLLPAAAAAAAADPAAARERLARRGLAVLDVGFGCGDQTVELARAVDAPLWRSFRYVGLTLNRAQLQVAYGRVHRGADPRLGPDSLRLFGADAAKPASWPRPVRALVDGIGAEEGERWLLALDCMYHFAPSRAPLLRYAARELRADLMAFDLLLNDRAPLAARLLVRLAGRLAGCPLGAFVTRDEYARRLVEAGYDAEAVRIRDVTSDVFGGLVAFMEKQQRALRPYGIAMGSLGAAKRLFDWVDNTGVLRAVIVVARVKRKTA